MTLLDGVDWSGKIFTGHWEDAKGGTMRCVEPATGANLGEVGIADPADITRACEIARDAQPAWAATPGPERAALLRQTARVVEDNRAELESWLVREGGAVPGKAAFEVSLVLNELWEAAALPTQPWGHLLATSEAGRESIAQRLPLGVVGVITPVELPADPVHACCRPRAGPGQRRGAQAGRQTAVSGGVLMARMFEEAGLPAGVLQVLAGDAEPGGALCADPNVAMISFTGSTAVGREVGATAGRTSSGSRWNWAATTP